MLYQKINLEILRKMSSYNEAENKNEIIKMDDVQSIVSQAFES